MNSLIKLLKLSLTATKPRNNHFTMLYLIKLTKKKISQKKTKTQTRSETIETFMQNMITALTRFSNVYMKMNKQNKLKTLRLRMNKTKTVTKVKTQQTQKILKMVMLVETMITVQMVETLQAQI